MSNPGVHKNRRSLLRVLFALDVSTLSPKEVLRDIFATLAEEEPSVSREVYQTTILPQAKELLKTLPELDAEITRLSPRWRIERMAAVDRNLLRLGIYEILEKKESPLVTINACVELGKEFGESTTPGFINGLLDQLCQDHKIPIK